METHPCGCPLSCFGGDWCTMPCPGFGKCEAEHMPDTPENSEDEEEAPAQVVVAPVVRHRIVNGKMVCPKCTAQCEVTAVKCKICPFKFVEDAPPVLDPVQV